MVAPCLWKDGCSRGYASGGENCTGLLNTAASVTKPGTGLSIGPKICIVHLDGRGEGDSPRTATSAKHGVKPRSQFRVKSPSKLLLSQNVSMKCAGSTAAAQRLSRTVCDIALPIKSPRSGFQKEGSRQIPRGFYHNENLRDLEEDT